MNTFGALSRGARVGRVLALVLTGLAVGWVLVLTLSIAADRPRTSTLVIIVVQAVLALGLQAYVIWRIATGWSALSNGRRAGLTVLGVVVAPIVSAFALAGVVIAVVIGLVLAFLAAGADRSPGGSSRSARTAVGGAAGAATGWSMPEATKKKCSMCDNGQLPCSPCAGSGYRYADGVAVGLCSTCGGSRGVRCGSCGGTGYVN
ncbi:MAG TPA: hypothetical protein VFP34_14250 [Microlunatus sp.]|nr:hypothetical protein [Microlunatus sp.]